MAAQDQPETFTKMSVGDVEAVGSHCQMPFCHQLDFLPFRCESCKGTFCLDHRTETAHKCPNEGAWLRARAEAARATGSASTSSRPTILNHDSQCSHPSCKTLINTPLVPGVECSGCNRSYCLQHRLREDHDCAKLPPIGARVGGSKGDRGLSDALGKLRAWGAAKRSAVTPVRKGSSSDGAASTSKTNNFSNTPTLRRIISPFSSARASSQAAQLTAINKLKASAKGDSKIPADKRVYLHVEAVREGPQGSEGAVGAKIPQTTTYYSSDWSVGKILDAAAKTLGVTNVNNRGGGEEERLRVFHVEGGRLLPFAEKLGEKVKTGDTIVLLRGVGAQEAEEAMK